MNIFGNAIKYTESGHIHVSLRANAGSRVTGAPTTITLTVTDSGMGMTPEFLANKAFQPFSQENPVSTLYRELMSNAHADLFSRRQYASGTGLGLSIIRQIIETNGGKIEVNSEPHVGTRMTVKLALSHPESLPASLIQRVELRSFVPRLEGRKICILWRPSESDSHIANMTGPGEGLLRFTNTLTNTLERHLRMQVVRTTKWEGHDADIVIVPELSFEYLGSIRSSRSGGGRAPVTIFVAMDALEAATLRSDARVKNKESVVEIMTQP
jgi:hypothetical protein